MHLKNHDTVASSERGRKRSMDDESRSDAGSMKRHRTDSYVPYAGDGRIDRAIPYTGDRGTDRAIPYTGNGGTDRYVPYTGDGRTIYVGNLAFATTQQDVQKLFKGYNIEAMSMPINPRDKESLGHAFVYFSMPSEAERAIDQLDGTIILGRSVYVRYARRSLRATEAWEPNNDKPSTKNRKARDNLDRSPDVDHSRNEALTLTNNATTDLDSTSWPDLTDADRADAGSPIRNRWQKLIARSRPAKESNDESHGSRRKQERQEPALEYGRLSPCPTFAPGTPGQRARGTAVRILYSPRSFAKPGHHMSQAKQTPDDDRRLDCTA